MQLIILASGRGKRLKKHTKVRPKCMIEINNKPIIKYQSSLFKYFSRVIMIVGYKSDQIKKALSSEDNIIFINNKNY